jgi:succinate-semialdehyde dehydrogenase/glutarate-semialdehyde dehydrogenase
MAVLEHHRRLDDRLIAALLERIVAAPRATTVTTTAPGTGETLAEVPQSTPQDVALAVEGARAAQRSWAARDRVDRASVLLRLHDIVVAEQEQVLDLIQLESGKARAHAFEEVADVAIVARHYGRRAKHYLRPRRRPGLVPGLTVTHELRHPKGVVGIVAPWNYPLTLAVSDALPALVAGNAVVLKPDSKTPLTALWAASALAKAGLPDGLLQIVIGDGDTVGSALVDAADYICFTGSTATGRVVAAQAAHRLVGASLELGGKNSLYVADDSDVDVAAEGAVRSCFASAGQLCISTERLVLHESIADDFLAAFLPRVRSIRLGAGLDYSADMGSLISPAQLESVVRHVDDAVSHGATVLTGGRPRPDVGPLFYEPTVLDGVPEDAECFACETFGPVVAVYRVASDSEAVRFINATDYGLNASVWTRDAARGRRIARQIKAGTVNVNEGYMSTWGSVGAPMGGMKASGLGRRHGAEGITKYTEPQTVSVQLGAHRGLGLGAVLSRNPERWTSGVTLALRAQKALGWR